MRASRFTVAAPVPGTDETFLFNSLTDTQIVVSTDVVELLARVDRGEAPPGDVTSRDAVGQLTELGFLVESRDAEDRALEAFFRDVREDASHLRVTLLTTLQCNFACDYCIQGDHRRARPRRQRGCRSRRPRGSPTGWSSDSMPWARRASR